MANRTFSISEANALFKIKYEKLSENVYNSANVLLGRVKKSYKFTGKQMNIAVPQSFAGGVGSGTLPTANSAIYGDAQISAKKVYAVVEIDRETIKASLSSEGAFVRATKEVVQKGVESWMRNMSRILFNDGTGALGTIAGTPTGTAAAPVIVISAATFKEANFEERDIVDIDSSVFEISSVAPATRAITLARLSGSDDLTDGASTAVVYMQGSEDNDPEGLKGVLDATTLSKYNINIARRWQAHQKDASAALTTDLMNEMVLAVKKKSGKSPNLIMTSYEQFEKLLNLLEDQKRYNVEPRCKDLKGKVSFSGVQFMGIDGVIGVFPERFCEDDRMYFLNDNYIHIYHRPDFGWFDDDGTVFLRKASSDAYEARYGGYLQVYINPNFHGVMTGLS